MWSAEKGESLHSPHLCTVAVGSDQVVAGYIEVLSDAGDMGSKSVWAAGPGRAPRRLPRLWFWREAVSLRSRSSQSGVLTPRLPKAPPAIPEMVSTGS